MRPIIRAVSSALVRHPCVGILMEREQHHKTSKQLYLQDRHPYQRRRNLSDIGDVPIKTLAHFLRQMAVDAVDQFSPRNARATSAADLVRISIIAPE